MAKKELQVFISSTYIDLIDERQSAVQAVLDSGHIPAGMELFKAGNETQLETIYKWIDNSDVYISMNKYMADTLEENPEEYSSQFHLGEIVNIEYSIFGKQNDAETIPGGNVKCLICNLYKKHNGEINLILKVLTRLQAYQDSPYKCRENAMAITK